MKNLVVVIFFLIATYCLAQQQTAPEILSQDKRHLLDSIFPIENIISVEVTNYNGAHTLTPYELAYLIKQLKQARFAGGLLIKPGHILLEIKLKDNSILKPGFVYASTGAVHFDCGVNKFNEKFSGTYYLPTKLNFDNYK